VKIFISADMEGISGVERVEDVISGLPGYEVFRRVMAGDVNAVVEGAFDGGATEVVVADGHARMTNIRPADLDPRARLKSGMSRDLLQLKGVSREFDAVLYVGYHAMSGTPVGVLSHTYMSSLLDVRVNGVSRGEAEINAYALATLGVPVVFLSGDDVTIAQARAVIGDVEYVQTKRATGRLSADHRPLEESRRLLTERARNAVAGLTGTRPEPPLLEEPVTVEIDLAVEPGAMADMRERNRRFIDDDEDVALSDFELITRYEPGLDVPREGTVAVTGSLVECYRTVARLAMHFADRNLTWLADDVGDQAGYDRDLDSWSRGALEPVRAP
jgi:D-amino peptidase